jgi:hypothetical protein
MYFYRSQKYVLFNPAEQAKPAHPPKRLPIVGIE